MLIFALLVTCVTAAYGAEEISKPTENETQIIEEQTQAEIVSGSESSAVNLFSAFAGMACETLASLGGSRAEPQASNTAKVKSPFLIALVRKNPKFFAGVKSVLFNGTDVKIKGFSGNYCLVEANNVSGYVFKGWLDGIYDFKIELSKEFDHVYAGGHNKGRLYVKGYDNSQVTWSFSPTGYVKMGDDGKLYGIKPGTVKATATVGFKSEECYVHCVYKWKSNWTGKAVKSTNIYTGPGEEYGKWASLSQGSKFTVEGDEGGKDGWAYGESNGKWGFVRIENISTKGTVSQYNKMGWRYPIKNTKFTKISSVYGWRGDKRHLGVDINKGDYSSIEGEELVAPFSGKIVFANTSYDYSKKSPDYGYCVIIESSSEVDPVSGNKLRVAYMHMNSKSLIDVGEDVEAGQIVGRVGTTGNSTGPHLHIEINNKGKNFAGTTNSDSFDKTINPIFFYMDRGMKDSSDKTDNEYWYNENK